MRLIDADAFKDWILSHFAEPQNELVLTLQGFIAEQPTAYDIDKVVEELESEKRYGGKYDSYYEGNLYHGEMFENDVNNKTIDKAIEIVKQGGVSYDVCEWKVFDNSLTGEPQWVYETTCGKCVGEEHTSKAFVYCPYCSKKIKVVE